MRKIAKNAIILFQHERNYIICIIGKTKQIIFIVICTVYIFDLLKYVIDITYVSAL